MDFGGKRAAATATGMFDGMQYIGGAAVGAGMAVARNMGLGSLGPA